jgi:hypothetical protein
MLFLLLCCVAGVLLVCAACVVACRLRLCEDGGEPVAADSSGSAAGDQRFTSRLSGAGRRKKQRQASRDAAARKDTARRCDAKKSPWCRNVAEVINERLSLHEKRVRAEAKGEPPPAPPPRNRSRGRPTDTPSRGASFRVGRLRSWPSKKSIGSKIAAAELVALKRLYGLAHMARNCHTHAAAAAACIEAECGCGGQCQCTAGCCKQRPAPQSEPEAAPCSAPCGETTVRLKLIRVRQCATVTVTLPVCSLVSQLASTVASQAGINATVGHLKLRFGGCDLKHSASLVRLPPSPPLSSFFLAASRHRVRFLPAIGLTAIITIDVHVRVAASSALFALCAPPSLCFMRAGRVRHDAGRDRACCCRVWCRESQPTGLCLRWVGVCSRHAMRLCRDGLAERRRSSSSSYCSSCSR